MPREVLEESIHAAATHEIRNLEKHLPVLSAIASLAPLMGLLGTVLGMILTFQEISRLGGQADMAALAGGIWQALLTTAAGLLVAIPAAIAAALLAGRAEGAAAMMEQSVGALMTAADGHHLDG